MFRRNVRIQFMSYERLVTDMTYVIDFSDMTDRELRIYKKAIQKRRELRLRFCKLLLAVVIGFAGLMIAQSASDDKAYAADNSMVHSYKYYTQIIVEKGDTLWNIAEEYIDFAHYDSVKDYVKEVCTINHCEADNIISGQSLIIPYYSNEFVY